MLAREREAPSERVQQVGHDLLPHHEHNAPAHLEHGHSRRVRVGSPHEDGQAQEAEEGQERPVTESHLERCARTHHHQRLSQKRFAPSAAPHKNHSRRPSAVKTSTMYT